MIRVKRVVDALSCSITNITELRGEMQADTLIWTQYSIDEVNFLKIMDKT